MDDNANPGTNYIKLSVSSDSNSGQTFDLPISIDKTKTDFSLAPPESSNWESSSSLFSNIGDNEANSLSVGVNFSEWN